MKTSTALVWVGGIAVVAGIAYMGFSKWLKAEQEDPAPTWGQAIGGIVGGIEQLVKL